MKIKRLMPQNIFIAIRYNLKTAKFFSGILPLVSGILPFILVNVKGLISAGEFPNEPPEVACQV